MEVRIVAEKVVTIALQREPNSQPIIRAFKQLKPITYTEVFASFFGDFLLLLVLPQWISFIVFGVRR
jgi:hypothetical protein